jgi:hypothetical protein
LGLAFEAGRLEGVLVRRTNGSGEVKRAFAAALSLDVLTEAPELVGREIRKHLDAADIRERRCVVGIPLSWAITVQVPLPDLPPADLDSFLQLEAERGFPYALDALLMAQSRYRTPGGTAYATLVAVPRDHIARIEAVLQAAQLRPISFSLGITALQGTEGDAAEGVLALAPSDHNISLQVSCGGGVAVLRTLEGVFELEGGTPQLQADQVARETRVTLGQLPADLRAAVRRVRVFGRDDTADALAEQLRPRFAPMGVEVEQVRELPAAEYGMHLAGSTPASAALALAVRSLTGTSGGFEFLPPRVSTWQRMTSRYASRKLVWGGATAGAVAACVALAFLYQQVQLWRWGGQWETLKPRATVLDKLQQQIKQYRPWFDDSVRSLAILRRLSEAFPEDGSVSAKTVEIREAQSVTCSGTARNRQELIRTLDRLRAAKEVFDLRVPQTQGRAAVEFTFSFRWVEGGGS